jgi:hypothetical protein
MGVYGVEIECPLCSQKHPAILFSGAVGTNSPAYTSDAYDQCEQRVFLLRVLEAKKKKDDR